MKQVVVYLTEEEHEELRQRAFKEKVSMSGLLKALFKFGKKVEPQVKEITKEITKPPPIEYEFNETQTYFNPVPKSGKKKGR